VDEDKPPTEDLETTNASEPEGGSTQRIGNYRILQKVGEGGMGEVYEAEQEKPVRRRVALKIIKHGMDTKQVVARFEAERQALAMMDHPSVAKVFEAGATPRGRPYFVMEFVRGVPITEHCDRQKLPVRERLELFLQVCEGVQHAHQNAIIHRDLKPSNVLVSIQDGRAVPKIIDFGVAKATTQKLTEKTMFTELGVLIGTPEYMSPEQAEGTGQSVDTRTDVYSLGVMLYELLVGALPFDPRELRSGGYEGIRKQIREEEPPKPSTRLSTLGDASTESAKSRRVDLPILRRQLRGDLDWITMRALEKDRTRRYGSPTELAADIGRYLADEPVLATPPGTLYKMKKFARRHKIGVAAAGVLLVLLLAFAATITVQARRIAAERDRANREADRANREAESATGVAGFLTNLFNVSDPSEARGNSVTAREMLDRGAAEIEESLVGQPEVQAQLMVVIGRVYKGLGLYADGESLLERALTIRRRELGDEHADTLSAMHDLANIYWYRQRYADAEPLYLEVVDKRTRVLGQKHPDTLVAMFDLASLYFLQKRYDEMEQLTLKTLELQREVLGEEHTDTTQTMHNLASLYLFQNRDDEALPLAARVVEIETALQGEDHPGTLSSMYNLATIYVNLDRDEEAERLFRETLDLQRRVLGAKHRHTLSTMSYLGWLLDHDGRPGEAEPLLVEALAGLREVIGAQHLDTMDTVSDLGFAYQHLGRFEEAEALQAESLDVRRRALGEDDYRTLNSVYRMACLRARQGRRDQAIRLLRGAVDRGWAKRSILEEPAFQSLRGDAEMQALLAEVSRKLD